MFAVGTQHKILNTACLYTTIKWVIQVNAVPNYSRVLPTVKLAAVQEDYSEYEADCKINQLNLQAPRILTASDTLMYWHYFTISFFLSRKGFSHLDVMLVECYDPKADQWNILQTPILEGRSGPGCAVLDDNIVLVGGYSWSMVYLYISDNNFFRLKDKAFKILSF